MRRALAAARLAHYFARDRLDDERPLDAPRLADDRELDDLRRDDARPDPLRDALFRVEPDPVFRALLLLADEPLREVLVFAALPRNVVFFALLRGALFRFVPLVVFFAARFFGGPPPPWRALFSAMAIACFCAFFLLEGWLVPIDPFLSYESISLLMLLLIVSRLEPFFKGMMCSFR